MKMAFPLSILTAAFTAAGLFLAGAADASQARPVLVELFTSEGCPSCPPADALLGQIAKQPGVVALAWHVDYMDSPGRKDHYSIHSADERQIDYSERFKLGMVYTPQLVVDGSSETIGSDAGAAARLIQAAAVRPPRGPELDYSSRPDGTGSVSLGSGAGAGTVWLVSYDPAGTTPGAAQVVRKATRLGTWHGKPLDLALPKKAASAEVVFVQPDGPGPMLATLALDR